MNLSHVNQSQLKYISKQNIQTCLFNQIQMGQLCYQVTADQKTFIKKAFIIKQDQFESSQQFDKNIPILREKINNIGKIYKQSTDQQNVFKHRQDNRYFIGSWDETTGQAKGTLYMPDAFLYQGAFQNGHLQGQGQIFFINKQQQYKGQFEDGKANGHGLYKNDKKKFTFEGQWQDSKPSKGILIFEDNPNIKKIEVKDFQSGIASISYKDGRQYQGQIDRQKFVPSGQGQLHFIDGSLYKGSWKNGMMHGKGSYQWKDGSKYDGDYSDNKKQGQGTFIYTSGKKYVGMWANGKQDGNGKIFGQNGQLQKEGQWKDGKYQANTEMSVQKQTDSNIHADKFQA